MDNFDSGTYQQILGIIRAHPILPHSEVVRLAKAKDRGDINAKDRLVLHNLGLAVAGAHKWRGGLSLVDAVHEGVIGLIRAVELYDWHKGFRFSTYATMWVRQSIGRADESHGRHIHVPADKLNVARKARALMAERGEHDRQGISDVARRLDVTPEVVQVALAATAWAVSTDAPVGETASANVGDLIVADGPSPQDISERASAARALRRAMTALPDREQIVLRARYGLGQHPCTFEQIAQSLGVSKERARQIERRALDRLGASDMRDDLHSHLDAVLQVAA